MINATNPVTCAIEAIKTVFPDADNIAVVSDLFSTDGAFISNFYASNSFILVKKQRIVMMPKWNIGYSKKRRFSDANVAVINLKTRKKTVFVLNAKKSPLFTAVDLLYASSFVLTIKEGASSGIDVGIKANEAYMKMLKEYTVQLEKGFDEIRDFIAEQPTE